LYLQETDYESLDNIVRSIETTNLQWCVRTVTLRVSHVWSDTCSE